MSKVYKQFKKVFCDYSYMLTKHKLLHKLQFSKYFEFELLKTERQQILIFGFLDISG